MHDDKSKDEIENTVIIYTNEYNVLPRFSVVEGDLRAFDFRMVNFHRDDLEAELAELLEGISARRGWTDKFPTETVRKGAHVIVVAWL